MSGELSKFEVESTKTPVWLPIFGVVVFFVVVVIGVMCPGADPMAVDGGTQEGQTE